MEMRIGHMAALRLSAMLVERDSIGGEEGLQIIPLVSVEVIVELSNVGSRHADELVESIP